MYTVEPLYKDTPEMRTSPLIGTLGMVQATFVHRKVYRPTPEMRTPPLIRTLEGVPSEGVWNGGVPLYVYSTSAHTCTCTRIATSLKVPNYMHTWPDVL